MSPARSVQRTLVMVHGGENISYAMKEIQPAGGTTANTRTAEAKYLFNANLVFLDDRSLPYPVLAESIPELNTSSWQVLPDGKMEITYRLKPNLTWHDGQPLTADDWVFAWRVYANPVFGISSSGGLRYLEEVTAPDSRTVVQRWKQGFPDAVREVLTVPPLPRHILEQPYQELQPEPFMGLKAWREEYVGLGPWKLDRFEPGAFVEGVAFDGFVFGRPKIDRVKVVYMPDTNVAIAALLSGDVHFSMESLLHDDEGPLLQQGWAANKGGIVLSEPIATRAVEFQGKPEFANPTELATDVRVRQALAHIIDRQALLEVLTNNTAILRDLYTHPKEDFYDIVAQAAPIRYRPDQRRAQQLLEEAGFTRSTDGAWRTPSGERFTLESWYLASGTNERESHIMVDSLRRFGVEATSHVWGVQRVSNEDRAKTPGMFAGSKADPRFHSKEVSGPDNRWTGANRYGFVPRESMDAYVEGWDTTLDRSQRVQHMAVMERIANAELPALPMYFRARVLGHSSALKGVVTNLTPGAGGERRIWEWYWES
jgi:peptide/nickel transport system substrate-binding protein